MNTTLLTHRFAIERMAMALYQDHSFMHRQKMTPAQRTQAPKPPTWTEVGTKIRSIWRQNALELMMEQQTAFSDTSLEEFFQ